MTRERPAVTDRKPAPYRGVFPVVPTVFDDHGNLDLAGQRRALDFMIDAGSEGLCILANFSEQFALTDAERDQVMHAALDHVAGRVPVIVTTTPFQHEHLRRTQPQRRSRRGGDGDGACRPITAPPSAIAEPGIFDFFRARVGCDRDPDHDPGRAGRRHAAVGRLARPHGARDRAGRLFQDRNAGRGGQAARADRARRRGDRRAVGRRGRHHPAGRSRRRGDRER